MELLEDSGNEVVNDRVNSNATHNELKNTMTSDTQNILTKNIKDLKIQTKRQDNF